MDSLVGMTFSQWHKLLQENKYATAPRFWPKSSIVTAKSFFNTKVARLERKEWGEQIDKTSIDQAPVFVLGHWRSGTSMLQNYLAQDPQFATPCLADVIYPNSLVRFHTRFDDHYVSGSELNSRPMDNVKVNLGTPGEDEFALAAVTLRSPLLSWVFPKNSEHYDRYLTFDNVDEKEVKEWRAAFLYYVKKLTLTYKKQILLKSPQHTARIHLLLSLFPDAKFIHIHRHPYALFKSTQKLYQTAVSSSALQSIPKDATSIERILGIHTAMYDSFFKYKDRIPAQNFVDIAFERIERDPVEAIKHIYQTLKLDGFEAFLPILTAEVEKNRSYKKNKYTQLSEHDKRQIYEAWQRSFEYWNYNK